VDIDLRVCDPQLLAGFWQRHEQQQQQQQVDDGTAGSSSLSSSSSRLHIAMPPRETLPSFSDRLLIFHRGVGLALAPGLYLQQKLDLLVEYLALRPAAAAADSVRAALAGLTGGQPDEQTSARQRQQSGRVYRLSSAPPSLAQATASDSEGDDAELEPALRAVLRHSLRSLMPNAGSVLRRFWEPLVLQVRWPKGVAALLRQCC
jgi:hypothetical protein